MNPMFDFTAKEINMINMALFAIARTTQEVSHEGVEPPDGFLETLESVVDKMNQVIEVRMKNDEDFESLVNSQLHDVEQSFSVLVKNPDVEIDDYK